MPGFNINGLGGNGPSNVLEIRRKYRWTFVTLGPLTQQQLLVLKKAARPSFDFTEAEMHHSQEVAYFAGKQKWEPISMVWYDVEQNPDMSLGIYNWLNTVVALQTVNVAAPSSYKQQAQLQMEDGFGNPDETWIIYGCWPKAVNWQELDYTSTDLQEIEATLIYDRAIRSCTNSAGTNNATSSGC